MKIRTTIHIEESIHKLAHMKCIECDTNISSVVCKKLEEWIIKGDPTEAPKDLNKKRIYFSHPPTHYNTAYEHTCIQKIKQKFNDIEIVNPNSTLHQEGYKVQGERYLIDLIKGCDYIVGITFKDGELSHAIYKDLSIKANKKDETFILKGNTIKKVDADDLFPLSVNETKRRIVNNVA